MNKPSLFNGALNRRHWLLVAGAGLATTGAAWAAGSSSPIVQSGGSRPLRPLRLAVVPQLTPVEMYARWAPLVEQLALRGVACELIIHPSIASFESEFLEGKSDVAFVNPYHMVMANKAHGYLPVLRSGDPLQGVLVSHKDSGVRTLAQLKDQKISFPAPNALAASLYIRAILDREHRLSYEPHFAKNHRNAVRQVLVGDSAAAGVVRTTLDLEADDIKRELQVVYSTPPVAAHPIAVHPRVSPARRDTLVQAMKSMATDPALAPIVDGVMLTHLTSAQYERDYAPLAKLGLERYVIRE